MGWVLLRHIPHIYTSGDLWRQFSSFLLRCSSFVLWWPLLMSLVCWVMLGAVWFLVPWILCDVAVVWSKLWCLTTSTGNLTSTTNRATRQAVIGSIRCQVLGYVVHYILIASREELWEGISLQAALDLKATASHAFLITASLYYLPFVIMGWRHKVLKKNHHWDMETDGNSNSAAENHETHLGLKSSGQSSSLFGGSRSKSWRSSCNLCRAGSRYMMYTCKAGHFWDQGIELDTNKDMR